MKKSLIALAVASAFVAPVAMAESTIYGNVSVSIDKANDGVSGGSAKTYQLNSRQSNLGLKGMEDLGGGMSAIWQIESDIVADNGGTTLGDRDTFLGMKINDIGTVLVGRHDTPYKMATRNLDVFADTTADNRADSTTGSANGTDVGTQGMGAGHDIRVANSLNYMSTDMSGLSVAVATVFGAEGAGNGDAKGSARSLAVMYTMDSIYATLAIQNAKAGDNDTGDLAANGTLFGDANPNPSLITVVAGDKVAAFKLGGGYTMDMFALNLVYEKLSFKPKTGSEGKNTNIYLAGKYNLSSTDAIKLAYTKLGDLKSDAGTFVTGAKQTSLGYDHSMSKNTMVYALYTKVKGNGTTSPTSDAPTAWSFGMKHSF